MRRSRWCDFCATAALCGGLWPMLCCARADIGADVARRQDELGGPEPCLQIHDGFGFACEYDVERKFCETRRYQVAPIFSNMILGHVAEHVLKLPHSY